jgi:DNA-binding MarR family transcriptional regulator
LEKQAREMVACLDTLFHRLLLQRMPVEPEGEFTAQECRALAVLGYRGGLIMSDFANALGVPLSTATHAADRLVDKGVVVRARSDEDRRIVRVELSEEGRRRERIFFERRLAMGRDMLASLRSRERDIFLELMAKVTHLAASQNENEQRVNAGTTDRMS